MEGWVGEWVGESCGVVRVEACLTALFCLAESALAHTSTPQDSSIFSSSPAEQPSRFTLSGKCNQIDKGSTISGKYDCSQTDSASGPAKGRISRTCICPRRDCYTIAPSQDWDRNEQGCYLETCPRMVGHTVYHIRLSNTCVCLINLYLFSFCLAGGGSTIEVKEIITG